MRIEVTDLVPVEELEPGDIYSDKPQEWWDLTLADDRIGVVLFIRSEYPLPEAYLGTATHKVIVHKDEEGVRASTKTHIADDPPSEVPDEEEIPPADDFHCKACGGMGVGSDDSSCVPCQGTGVTPRG